MISAAFTFPVWRRCGPLHKSISGPHLCTATKMIQRLSGETHIYIPVYGGGWSGYFFINDSALEFVVLLNDRNK